MKWKPGQSGNPSGRGSGTRNKLSHALVVALQKEFEVSGEEAIRIAAKEHPLEFVKIIASLCPKEFEINDNRLKDIPDDQLDAFIEFAKRSVVDLGDIGSGEDETAH